MARRQLLCATALLALPGLAAASAGGWPGDLPALLDGTDEALYLDVMQPVLQAVKLSYTATYGSYRRAYAVNATLGGGWERRPELDVDPSGGGFHGLVFFHAASRRSVLAIRGTDLNTSSTSGLADTCADKLLWENATWETLPGACRNFSPSVLDYLGTAADFADRALAALPEGTAHLLVGHSLGAGLAVLLAADPAREQQYGAQALVLSAPPYDAVLRARVGREPRDLDAKRFANICNAYDPLYHNGTAVGGNLGAPICTFTPPEPDACVRCYGPNGQEALAACDECFAKTHVLKNYLDLLNGTVASPPPFRPRCATASAPNEPFLV